MQLRDAVNYIYYVALFWVAGDFITSNTTSPGSFDRFDRRPQSREEDTCPAVNEAFGSDNLNSPFNSFLINPYILLAVFALAAYACTHVIQEITRYNGVDDGDSPDNGQEEGETEDIDETVQQLPIESLDNIHERRLREAGYQGPIPFEFQCPISLSIMVNPVILIKKDHLAGQSIDEEMAIELIKRKNDRCPVTRQKFDGYMLNLNLRNIINDWVNETVKKMEEKQFNELPREVVKKKLLTAQALLFNKRAPNPRDESTQRFINFTSKAI